MCNKLLTNDQFDAILPRLGRLSMDTLNIAREVLVDGKSQSEVAREHNLSRQRVHGMVTRVNAAINDIPLDWVRLDTWLPKEMADKIQKEIELLKNEYYKSKEK